MMSSDDESDLVVVQDNEVEELPKQQVVLWFEPKAVLKEVKSNVWDFFKFKGTAVSGPKKDKVFCSLCLSAKKQADVAYSGGTSNLSNHLKNHHPAEFSKKEAEKTPNKITAYLNRSTVGDSLYKWPKTSMMWKKATKSLAIWLCKSSRPSNMVLDEGLRAFLGLLCPQYEIPCPNTISNYIREIYEENHKKIKEQLEKVEFLAVTTDGGTSSNAVSFQDTNVHYLDDNLNMQVHTLGVRENKEKHTAVNFRQKNDDLLDEFGVKEKVVKTVTDNENKMRAAYKDSERIGCLAHIFHKSVNNGCEKVNVVNKLILKTRKVAQKHNKSYAFRYGLQVAQKNIKIKARPLHQDVATRWGSTRSSMESFLDEKVKKKKPELEAETIHDTSSEGSSDEIIEQFKNSEAINEALRNLKYKNKQKVNDYLLSRTDMNRIKNIHCLLTKLDIFSTTLGGAKFVTISVVLPVIKSIIKVLKESEDDPTYISEMKIIMLADFKVRVQDLLDLTFLMKAVALDPRFKNMKVLDDKHKRDDIFKKLETEMTDHIDGVKTVDERGPTEKKRKLCLDFDESDDDEDLGASQDIIKREIASYRAEPVLDRDCDPLDWWRMRKSKYPNLVRLVRCVNSQFFKV